MTRGTPTTNPSKGIRGDGATCSRNNDFPLGAWIAVPARQTGGMSEEITLLHNPRCTTSRAALEAVEQSGRSFDVVQYLKTPLDADQLWKLVEILDDEPTRLVRRDAAFKKLGFTDDHVRTAEQVVAVLSEHQELLQRPVIIRHDAGGSRAIIGRPKEAVPEFLRGP